jgi:hypothetical protein
MEASEAADLIRGTIRNELDDCERAINAKEYDKAKSNWTMRFASSSELPMIFLDRRDGSVDV